MESINVGDATWYYNSEEELFQLNLLHIIKEIDLNLNKIKNEEYMEATSFFLLPDDHVSKKPEYISEIRRLILLFKNTSEMLYKNASKRVYISEEATISNKCITFYYGNGK